jgi:hypothetical protein
MEQMGCGIEWYMELNPELMDSLGLLEDGAAVGFGDPAALPVICPPPW